MPDTEIGTAVRRILDLLSCTPGVPIILIDGRSGSGKSELASELARPLDAQIVRLDDIYPGWDGLEAASERVVADVLLNHRWERWDWIAEQPAGWTELDPARATVIEGSGCLTRASRARATLGVWVQLDEASRKARALSRDGAMYAQHWDDWAAQEQRFFDRERPDLVADLVIRRAAD